MPPCKPRIRRKRLTNVKANGVYRKTTLCRYRNDCRWHLFTNKKTPCQPNSCARVLQKSWWCVCVFITEVHRATCSCFNTSAMTGSVIEKSTWIASTTPIITCQRGLSHLGGMVLITKTIQCEISQIITGTLSQPRTRNKFHMRTNTCGQDAFQT